MQNILPILRTRFLNKILQVKTHESAFFIEAIGCSEDEKYLILLSQRISLATVVTNSATKQFEEMMRKYFGKEITVWVACDVSTFNRIVVNHEPIKVNEGIYTT